MNIKIVNIIENHEHTHLVGQFLEMRRQVFVGDMNWDLPVHGSYEFEQYDQFWQTYYVLAMDDNRLVGGARLLRCDTTFGSGVYKYSYMIRDAYLGLIDLPKALCSVDPPTDSNSWELTRFVADPEYPEAGREILDGVNDYLVTKKASRCLFLGSPVFMRMARIYGYQPSALGPVCGNKDGRFVAFECPCVDRTSPRMEAAQLQI